MINISLYIRCILYYLSINITFRATKYGTDSITCNIVNITFTHLSFRNPVMSNHTGGGKNDMARKFCKLTLVPRVTNALLTATVDALAPYHPTAVGVFTRVERRPQDEWTLANMNTATLYAAYHSHAWHVAAS